MLMVDWGRQGIHGQRNRLNIIANIILQALRFCYKQLCFCCMLSTFSCCTHPLSLDSCRCLAPNAPARLLFAALGFLGRSALSQRRSAAFLAAIHRLQPRGPLRARGQAHCAAREAYA